MEFLYLIDNPQTQTFKIGRTADIPGRKRNYKTHNPLARWQDQIEVVNAVAIENRAKEFLRETYPLVPGTDEWFQGYFSVNQFRQLVDEIAPQDDFDNDCDDLFLGGQIAERISEYLGPVEGLMWDARQGGFEWLDGIKVDVRVTDDHLEFRLDNTRSALLVLLCADPEMTVAELISQIGLGHPLHNPMYEQLEEFPLRDILEGPIVIEKQ